jgi:hypothetical protein
MATGKGRGGFALGAQEKADLEEDATPIRTSTYARHVRKSGTFFRRGW